MAPGIVGPDQAAALTVRVYMDHSDSMADLPGIREDSSRRYRLHAPGGTPATVWFCCCNECTRRGGGYSFETLSIPSLAVSATLSVFGSDTDSSYISAQSCCI